MLLVGKNRGGTTFKGSWDSWTHGTQGQEGYAPQRAKPSLPQQAWNYASRGWTGIGPGMFSGNVIRDNFACR
eukprot:12929563-Prorocentrum_lima.AAC.1